MTIYIQSDFFRELEALAEQGNKIATLLYNNRFDRNKINNYFCEYIDVSSKYYNDANYINFDFQTGMMSYVDKKREIAISDKNQNIWIDNRYTCKPGAIINKMFKKGIFKDKDIEGWVTFCKSLVGKNQYEFSIVDGENIPQYYHYESYVPDCSGTLGVSCMRHDRCIENYYFQIYVKNKTYVKLLILQKNNKLVGRALLWEVPEKDGTKFRFMDRIYCHDENLNNLFINWANENDYWHKEKQSWQYPHKFKKKKDVIDKEIKLFMGNYDYYPYLDTFKWKDEDGYYYNYYPKEIEKVKNIRTVIHTEGALKSRNFLKFSDYQDKYIKSEYARNIKYLNSFIDVNELKIAYIEHLGLEALEKHIKWDESINDYVFIEEYDDHNDKDRYDARKKLYEESASGGDAISKLMDIVKNKLNSSDISKADYDKLTYIYNKLKKSKAEKVKKKEEGLSKYGKIKLPTSSSSIYGSYKAPGSLTTWANITKAQAQAEDSEPAAESTEQSNATEPESSNESGYYDYKGYYDYNSVKKSITDGMKMDSGRYYSGDTYKKFLDELTRYEKKLNDTTSEEDI